MPNPREATYALDERKGTLTIVLPLIAAKRVEDLPKSKTGKSYCAATTHGIVKPAGCEIHGRQIRVGINVFIPLRKDR